MRGSRNPPAPTKNSGIQWVPEFLLYLSCKRGCKGGFEQQRSRPPPAAETGRRGWGSAPLFQSPAKGLRKKRQAQLVRPAEQSGGKKAPVQQRRPLPAAETGRSCWGCGQQDARAAQGTMQPLGAATRVPFLRGSRNPPAPTKKPQRIKIRCGFVLRCFFLLFLLRPPIRAAVLGCCFEQ